MNYRRWEINKLNSIELRQQYKDECGERCCIDVGFTQLIPTWYYVEWLEKKLQNEEIKNDRI